MEQLYNWYPGNSASRQGTILGGGNKPITWFIFLIIVITQRDSGIILSPSNVYFVNVSFVSHSFHLYITIVTVES